MNSVPTITLQIFGDWRKIQRALDSLPKAVKQSASWGQRKAAEKLIKIVKDHINHQDLGWSDRADSTNSNDPRILVDSGDYYAAIKAYSDRGTYYVGVKRNAFNSEGTRISDYAVVHEYGWGDIPARPLWRPSFEEINGSSGVRDIIMKSIHDRVKKLRNEGLEVNFTL